MFLLFLFFFITCALFLFLFKNNNKGIIGNSKRKQIYANVTFNQAKICKKFSNNYEANIRNDANSKIKTSKMQQQHSTQCLLKVL